MEVLTWVVQSRRKVALLVFTLYASIATGLSGEQVNRQVSEAEADKITKQVTYDGQNLALVEVCSCRQNG